MAISTSVKALRACDKGLRKALAEAAAAGDFDEVRRITVWAEEVKAMLVAAEAPRGNPVPRGPREKGPGTARDAGEIYTRRMLQDEYPRFYRRGEELVKVGWSKRDGREYQHRAPRRALDAVIAAVKRLTGMGEVFVSEDLSPLKDTEGGVFPTYQVFVALAWLRRLGIIHQPGRKSAYSLVPTVPVDVTVEAAWKVLPPWKG